MKILKNLILSLSMIVLIGACTTTPQMPEKMEENLVREKTKSLLRLGERMATKGDFRTAMQFYQKAHETQPLLNEPVLRQLDILYQAEDYGRVEKLLRDTLALDPMDEEITVEYARFLVQYDLSRAPTFLAEAAPRFNNARIYNWYGVALDLNGRHMEAQEAYETGRDVAPYDPALLNNLGLSYAVTGQTKIALLIFEDLIENEPNKTMYRRNRAIVQILAGDVEAARTNLVTILPQDEIDQMVVDYEGRLEIEKPLTILKRINNIQ